jgi:hypothetical protein
MMMTLTDLRVVGVLVEGVVEVEGVGLGDFGQVHLDLGLQDHHVVRRLRLDNVRLAWWGG